MNLKNCEIWLQISAGQGPLECAWVVMKVLEKIREEAELTGLDIKAIAFAQLSVTHSPDTTWN
jgi:protein subunit release factor B